jgi:uncharacterized protein involved in exopolysaccharide biosynthesis
MPSVKSYRNRKAEIEQLIITITQMREAHHRALDWRDTEIKKLEHMIQYYANLMLDSLAVQTPAPIILKNTSSEEIELLKKEIEALKVTLRLYREYVMKAYDPDAVNIIEIPRCLKPLDAIIYAGEKQWT